MLPWMSCQRGSDAVIVPSTMPLWRKWRTQRGIGLGDFRREAGIGGHQGLVRGQAGPVGGLLEPGQQVGRQRLAAHTLALAARRTGDTGRAVALIDGQLDGFYQRNAAQSLAEKLADDDPKAAVRTALTFTSPPARDAALNAALEKFQDGAPQGLALWLGELPPGRDTDRIIDALEKITAAAAPRDKTP